MSIGYDNLDINHNMVLDLRFKEGVGAVAYDASKNRNQFTLTHAPAWYNIPATGQPGLNFTAGDPDFLEAAIADVPDMDFTSEDFSYAGWINTDSLVGDRMVFCHGLLNTEGFYMLILADGSVSFISNQGAASQSIISTAGDVVINTPTLIGFSRSGTLGQIFINGREVVYSTQDNLTDPLTSARKFLFGIYDDETTDPWSQYMFRQRFWINRQLVKEEHEFIYNSESARNGV